MSKILILVLSTGLLALSAGADATGTAHTALMDICLSGPVAPSDGVSSEELTVDGALVALSYGGSEPDFSSHIEMDAIGDVSLIRKGKADLHLGKGVFPVYNPAAGYCNQTPFTVDPSLDVVASISKSLPYPHCNFEDGFQCPWLVDETTRVKIILPSETIEYDGAWSIKP